MKEKEIEENHLKIKEVMAEQISLQEVMIN